MRLVKFRKNFEIVSLELGQTKMVFVFKFNNNHNHNLL